MSGTGRARGTGEKLARRRQLLDAAASCLDARGYAATTMAQIAERAGLAKGTTYLYFASKEELFLELLSEAVGEWCEAALRALEGPPASEIEGVSEALARALADRPRFARLLALRRPVLERGAGEGAAEELRRRWSETLAPLAARLESFASPGTGQRTAERLLALAAGTAFEGAGGERAGAASSAHSEELTQAFAALLRGGRPA